MFSEVRPELDGVPYVIETATHNYTKSGGYTTAISAKLYDGKSGEKKKTSAATPKASTDAAPKEDKVAPNSPAGTPPTPADWPDYQRNGKTDSN